MLESNESAKFIAPIAGESPGATLLATLNAQFGPRLKFVDGSDGAAGAGSSDCTKGADGARSRSCGLKLTER